MSSADSGTDEIFYATGCDIVSTSLSPALCLPYAPVPCRLAIELLND